MGESISIGVLLLVSIYFYLLNKKIKKRNKCLKDENEFINSLRDRSNEEYRNKILNSERIHNSEIKLRGINEILVVKDELDLLHKGIDIYVCDESIVDLNKQYEFNEKKIAYIDLYELDDGLYKIEKLQVVDEYRRRGIATFLMERVMEWAELRNINELHLFASANIRLMSQAELMNFYSKFGFIPEDSHYMKIKFK